MPKPVEENNTAVSPVSDEVLNATDISVETVHSLSGYSWSAQVTVFPGQETTEPVQFFPPVNSLEFGTHPWIPDDIATQTLDMIISKTKSRVFKSSVETQMSKAEYLARGLGSDVIYVRKYFSVEELTNSKTAWETLADKIGFDDVKLLGTILSNQWLERMDSDATIHLLEVIASHSVKQFIRDMKSILHPSHVGYFFECYIEALRDPVTCKVTNDVDIGFYRENTYRFLTEYSRAIFIDFKRFYKNSFDNRFAIHVYFKNNLSAAMFNLSFCLNHFYGDSIGSKFLQNMILSVYAKHGLLRSSHILKRCRNDVTKVEYEHLLAANISLPIKYKRLGSIGRWRFECVTNLDKIDDLHRKAGYCFPEKFAKRFNSVRGLSDCVPIEIYKDDVLVGVALSGMWDRSYVNTGFEPGVYYDLDNKKREGEIDPSIAIRWFQRSKIATDHDKLFVNPRRLVKTLDRMLCEVIKSL